MAQPLDTAIPPNLVIGDGYVVRFTAIDPSTGALVSGVVVSEMTVQTQDVSASSAPLAPEPLLVPFAP